MTYLLLPLFLIAAGGVSGLYLVLLLASRSECFEGTDRLTVAVCLSIAIPVTAAASLFMGRSKMFRDAYGDLIEHTWIFVATAFVAGLLIGWAYSRGSSD